MVVTTYETFLSIAKQSHAERIQSILDCYNENVIRNYTSVTFELFYDRFIECINRSNIDLKIATNARVHTKEYQIYNNRPDISLSAFVIK